MVFLRLNTGTTKLSPQELRQALQPGPFADWVDEQAAKSESLRLLLGLDEPDFRMRDTEVLARFISFRTHLADYPGRLKRFLDETFEKTNSEWADLAANDPEELQRESERLIHSFETAIGALIKVFGVQEISRRPGSKLVNRTLLDMLLFYASDDAVAEAMVQRAKYVREAYAGLFNSSEFLSTIESDTASSASTVSRLRIWGESLAKAINIDVRLPELVAAGNRHQIKY